MLLPDAAGRIGLAKVIAPAPPHERPEVMYVIGKPMLQTHAYEVSVDLSSEIPCIWAASGC
jgi:hypothetical protein